ncbi:MAG TPA: HAD-IB family hydrolase [Polyangiaceae bacterium]|nr:HAD-IB family hydrolase [Polyangiaceae bacterium]
MAASYFDVDGTLVRTNLIHPTLYYLLNQSTPLATARKVGRALLRGPAMALAELRDRRRFNELLYSAYEGLSEDRLEVLSEQVFKKVLEPAFHPFALELMEQTRSEGRQIVLVSGELDSILRHVARYLNADHVIANRLEMKDRIATGRLFTPIVAGPTKARLIRDHARENGFDLDECHAYSDSYSDVPMLSVVGHPTAVNPDQRLRQVAKAYSWPILTPARRRS